VASTLRDDLLPVINELRALPNQFGIRRYTTTIRTRTWSGTYSGEGTPTDVDVVLTPVPRVDVISTDEVASSGGTYREGDFRITAITPAFVATPSSGGSGYSPSQLNLRPTAQNQDVTVILTGDEGTIECMVVEFNFSRPFRTTLVVREKRTAVGTTLG
jgi:hypothetical protein